METINLTVLKKSAKGAALVSDGNGVEFWVKPSCVREDGTFTPSVLKNYESEKAAFDAKMAFDSKFNFPKFWENKHKPGSFRIYMGDAFIPGSISERSPKGYYEGHRYCKGESWFSCFIFDSAGLDDEALTELIRHFEYSILKAGDAGMGANLTIMKKEGETYKEVSWR